MAPEKFKLLHPCCAAHRLFAICGSAYLVAWILRHLLVPRFEQVKLA